MRPGQKVRHAQVALQAQMRKFDPIDALFGKKNAPLARKRKAGAATEDRWATKRIQMVSTSVNIGPDVLSPKHNNPAACLDGLPGELLLDIFEHLPKPALARLSRMNKKLRGFADEKLYSTLRWEDMGEKARRGFVHSIGRKAELAALVKTIEAEYDVKNVDWTTYKKAVEVKRKDKQKWDEKKPRKIVEEEDLTGREARLLDLALNAATNVQTLVIVDQSVMMTRRHLGNEFWWMDLLVSAAQGTPVGPSHAFAQLKTLSIVSPYCNLPFEKLSDILSLPSLQEATIKGVFQTESVEDLGSHKKSSSVKRLVLKGFLHSDAVTQLLSSCHTLEHFTYTYTTATFEPLNFDSPKGVWAEHSWATIGKALATQKDSLQSLQLYYDVDPDIAQLANPKVADSQFYDDADPDTVTEENTEGVNLGTLGSLKAFPKLQIVAAPIDALAGPDDDLPVMAERLPAGLEMLDLRIDGNTQLKPEMCGAAVGSLAKHPQGLNAVHVSVGLQVKVCKLELSGAVVALNKAGVEAPVTRRPSHRVGYYIEDLDNVGVDEEYEDMGNAYCYESDDPDEVDEE